MCRDAEMTEQRDLVRDGRSVAFRERRGCCIVCLFDSFIYIYIYTQRYIEDALSFSISLYIEIYFHIHIYINMHEHARMCT